MGADGQIQVFDWKKVKEKFPDAGEKLTSSLGYIHIMKTPEGKEYEVFTGYHGDNIYAYWSDVGDIIALNESKEYQDRCREIIKWMEENAQLFIWEVWT